MRTYLTLLLLFLSPVLTLTQAQAEILLSQYVNGNENRKGLELFNPDAVSVDLSQYEIRIYHNGKTTPSMSVKLTDTLNSESYILIGQPALKAVVENLQQIANFQFNGDDAVVLYRGQTAVDRFGRIGEQPAKGWANISLDNSFKRNTLSNVLKEHALDPYATFDLTASWEKWSERNAFASYLNALNQSQTPVDAKVSCRSPDTPIADLATATLNLNYNVLGVITADYRYANGFSGFYLQTPDHKAKPNLSNAIFVYLPNGSTFKGGQAGEEVMVSGRLEEYKVSCS